MTIILMTSFVTVVLSLLLYKPIHKYNTYIYIATGIISLLSLSEEANIVTLGFVPFGIFLVVMLSGAMDKGILRKRLFMVRAELAIIASILLLPHAFGFLEYYLEDLGLDQGSLSFYLGIAAFLIAIPLFITSFQIIRRKMNYKQWKKLHKFAYMFYALVALHLILLQNDRMVLYIVLFISYFGIKVYNVIEKQWKLKLKKEN